MWVYFCLYSFILISLPRCLAPVALYKVGGGQRLCHPMFSASQAQIQGPWANTCLGLSHGPLLTSQVTWICIISFKIMSSFQVKSVYVYALHSSHSRALRLFSLLLHLSPLTPKTIWGREQKYKVSAFLKGHFSESFLRNCKEELHNGNHFAASSMAIYLNNHFI